MKDADRNLLLVPMPAYVRCSAGNMSLPERPALSDVGHTGFAKSIRKELGARVAADVNADIRLLPFKDVPAGLRKWASAPEGYGMIVGPADVRVWAASDAGYLYAAMTIGQLRMRYGSVIPCMRVGDRPVMKRRGIQLSFPQGHTGYRSAYMRHLVPWLARMKINELYLYLESFFDFPSLPHMAGPGAMTMDDARELDRLCGAYNIDVVPMLNTLAHCGELLATQRYNHLTEYDANMDRRTARPFNLCSCSPEVKRIVDGMLNDLCDCFSAPVIHVGGDEVSCIGACPLCKRKKKDALTLYVEYFGRILDTLEKRGKRGGIWGDMLLKYCRSGKGGKKSSIPATLKDRAVIYDWHYSGGSRDTLDFFVRSGVRTVASSSTHLCYSSALWPAQRNNQKALFKDAIAAGAEGGMTTAWVNWQGAHEEQFNYLHASGAALLWSGVKGGDFARGLSVEQFEKAYSLQRYGVRDESLTEYLHIVGDASGPVLGVLAPLHGIELRKCIYHTDSVLRFWSHYVNILGKGGLAKYRDGIAEARAAWDRIEKTGALDNDPYLRFLEGPLLAHEHLAARYEMTEDIYALYDRAAALQYEDPFLFRDLLKQAGVRTRSHLRDFKPVEAYLRSGMRMLGFDRSTMNRIQATKKGVRELAAFLKHLGKSHRPLPAFHQLHDTFLSRSMTNWYGDREHDWAEEDPRFMRYTLVLQDPWTAVEADADRE